MSAARKERVMHPFPSPPRSGPLRVIWIVGIIIFMVGFAIAARGIFSFIAEIANSMEAENPPDPDMGGFIQAATTGFPIAIAGGIIAGLAAAIGHRSEPPASYTHQNFTVHNPSSLVVSGRDTAYYGDQHINAQYTINHARQDIWLLRQATADLGLSPHDRQKVQQSLESADQELAKPKSNLQVVGKRIADVVNVLERANALYRAGDNIMGPLSNLMKVLGLWGKDLSAF
jgi:hypothetical protein